MGDVDTMHSLLKQLRIEWESEKTYYLSQIRRLEEENAALRKRKRKNILHCLRTKKKFENPGNQKEKSSADEQDLEEKLPLLMSKIGDIYNEMKIEYAVALQELAEQKKWNQVNSNQLRQTRNSHYNHLEGDPMIRLSPHPTEKTTTDPEKKNRNKREISIQVEQSIPGRIKEVPRRAKKCEEMTKDVKLRLEADRERLRLEMKVAAVEIAERNEFIDSLRTQIQVKDAQIVNLCNIIYVVKKLKFHK